MALNLIELIKASGAAGSSGQTFRNNVTGAGNGIKVSDYRVTGLTFTQYTNESTTYNPSAASSFTLEFFATVQRNSQAHQIQRLTASAWTPSIWTFSGSGLATASISSIQALGSPAGGSFRVYVQINPPPDYSGATFYSTTSDNGQPLYGSWQGVHAIQANYSSVGTMQLALRLAYDPDTASFNPGLTSEGAIGTTGATASMTGGSDYLFTTRKAGPSWQNGAAEVRWWDALAGDAYSQASSNDVNGSTYRADLENFTEVLWMSEGEFSKTNTNLWWRLRVPGVIDWTAPLPAFAPNDTRIIT